MTHPDPIPRFAFRCVGTPRPQPRPRISQRGGHVVSTGSKVAKLWRAYVERECRAAVGRLDIEPPLYRGPVRVTLLFVFKRPTVSRAANPKRHRELAAGAQPVADVDNLAKLAMDVMERCGVFGNDRRVVELLSQKAWGVEPSMSVLVEPVEDEAAPLPANAQPIPRWLSR
jgi:Holliday junction resolvase RusA-like endonuclease